MFVAAFLLLTATGHLRIFRAHLRSDNPEDQVGVDHFNDADHARGIKPKPMTGSDVYFGEFGGSDLGHTFVLVELPKECASEQYILHMYDVLVPEGPVWTAGPVALWWQPKRVHPISSDPKNKPRVTLDVTYSAQFVSPSCGPVRVGY